MVAELQRKKTELLEENARLQKGLEFLLDRYSPPATIARARSLVFLMSNESASCQAPGSRMDISFTGK